MLSEGDRVRINKNVLKHKIAGNERDLLGKLGTVTQISCESEVLPVTVYLDNIGAVNFNLGELTRLKRVLE